MQLALTDHLRCTEPHAETWLVARADVAEHGWMVEGMLGCPACHVERAVRSGVVHWDAAHDGDVRGAAAISIPDGDANIRLAALLALTDSHLPFVLCGAAGASAPALGGMANVSLVLINPPDDSSAGLATVIRGAPRVPFAERSVQGIALDSWHASPDLLDSAVRTLVPGGRMVAAAAVPVPLGIRELARDATEWVGERVAEAETSAPVALGRSRRSGSFGG